MRTATIHKRLVQGTHITNGSTKVLTAPHGVVESIEGSMVTIITEDGYRCRQKDILGAVSITEEA